MTIEQAIAYIKDPIGKNFEAHAGFERVALTALQEKHEREKGCVWCKENNKVFHDGQHFHMFCSYCGRRLEGKYE